MEDIFKPNLCIVKTTQIPEATSKDFIEEEVYSKIISAYECRLKARNLNKTYIDSNIKLINDFSTFTGLYLGNGQLNISIIGAQVFMIMIIIVNVHKEESREL